MNTGIKQRIQQNLLALSSEKLSTTVLGLIAVSILTRHLGPDNYGEYIYALSIVSIAQPLVQFGLPTVIPNLLVQSQSQSEKNQIIYTSIILSIVLATIGAVVLIVIFILSRTFGMASETVANLGCIFSLSILGNAGNTMMFIHNSQIQYGIIAKYLIIIKLVYTLSVLLFSYNQFSVYYLSLAYTSSEIIKGLFFLSKTISYLDNKTLKSYHPLTSIIEVLGHSKHAVLSDVINSWYQKVDIFMLQSISGFAAVGIYNAGTQIIDICKFIPASINQSIRPALLDLHNKNRSMFDCKLKSILTLNIYGSLLLAVILSVLAPVLIRITSGASFANAAAIMEIYAFTIVPVAINNTHWHYFSAYKLYKHGWIKPLTGLCANVLLNIALIPPLHAIGAAIATLCALTAASTIGIAFNEQTKPLYKITLTAFRLVH